MLNIREGSTGIEKFQTPFAGIILCRLYGYDLSLLKKKAPRKFRQCYKRANHKATGKFLTAAFYFQIIFICCNKLLGLHVSLKIVAMKIIFAVLAAIFCLSVAARRTTIEDPNAAVRTKNIAFAPISLSDGISLFLTTNTKETLAESFSGEKYEERFKTKETGGVFKIYLYNQGVDHSGDKRRKLKVYASFKILEMMIGSGNSSVMLPSLILESNL